MKADRFRQFRLTLGILTGIGLVAKLCGLLPPAVTYTLVLAPFLCFWGIFWAIGIVIVLIEVLTQKEIFNERKEGLDQHK